MRGSGTVVRRYMRHGLHAPSSGPRGREASVVTPAVVALAGVALLAVAVAWRLCGASYGGDVDVICQAEGRSGLRLGGEMQALGEWERGQLTTPAGNELLA